MHVDSACLKSRSVIVNQKMCVWYESTTAIFDISASSIWYERSHDITSHILVLGGDAESYPHDHKNQFHSLNHEQHDVLALDFNWRGFYWDKTLVGQLRESTNKLIHALKLVECANPLIESYPIASSEVHNNRRKKHASTARYYHHNQTLRESIPSSPLSTINN